MSLEDIRRMAKGTFLKLLKNSIADIEIALVYLINKRGSKGKEINYKRLKMAEYLMPHNNKIGIEEKRKLFSIRNNMIEIGNNFGKNENCMFCKTKEDMKI